MNKIITILIILLHCTSSNFGQKYERYKNPVDTIIVSNSLGYGKKISVLLPIEWQKDQSNTFPLVIIFDRQNRRSNNYILNTIDYLTSNEQMPSAIVVSIESEQRYRYQETQYKISDPNGRAIENERFLFGELIPFIHNSYRASTFNLLIGHSRHGYLTTSLLASRILELNGVIAMSPFFFQDHVNLVDSIASVNKLNVNFKKFYRFDIGNDFPEDYLKMDSMVRANISNPMIDIKGYCFKNADHNVTPGLLISNALYEIFEDWSGFQKEYISNEQKDPGIKYALDNEILQTYGVPINFSIGILNGKGSYFYNEKQYEKAILAWKILTEVYPNFSEAYLNIIDARIQLKQDYSEELQAFKVSLERSKIYSLSDKKELEYNLQELIN